MKRYVLAGAAALALGLPLTSVAQAVPNPQPPQTAVSPGTPCTPTVGSVTGVVPALMPKPCPPEQKPPAQPGGIQQPGQAPKVTVPATPAEATKATVPRRPKDDVDDWSREQVDKPLAAMRGLYETMLLAQPSLLNPNQSWVLTSWGGLLLIGLAVSLIAWLNHARHVFQGTDAKTGQSPLVRLGIPGLCIIMMLLAPAAWERRRISPEALHI